MVGLAPLQKVPVDRLWLDYPIVGSYSLFLPGIGASLCQRIRSAENYSHSEPSMPALVTGLANLGAVESWGPRVGRRLRVVRPGTVAWLTCGVNL